MKGGKYIDTTRVITIGCEICGDTVGYVQDNIDSGFLTYAYFCNKCFKKRGKII